MFQKDSPKRRPFATYHLTVGSKSMPPKQFTEMPKSPKEREEVDTK